MNQSLIILLLVRLSTAAISLATFSGEECDSDIGTNIQSNAANPADSSNCVATTQFNSIQVISADPGFQCNIYSDIACQNFLETFSTPLCAGIIGSGVICFNQAQFDNPIAGDSAQVTVSKKVLTVTASVPGSEWIVNGTQTSCGDTGCDPTNPFTNATNFRTEVDGKSGTFSVTMNGNYDNTDQRDFMASALESAVDTGTQNEREDPLGFTGGADNPATNPRIFDIPAFVQVVLNDAKGNNLASMSATIAFTADPGSDGACDSDTIKDALGLISEVGDIAGFIFDVVCS